MRSERATRTQFSSQSLLTISARIAQHGLIAAECRSLTGGVPNSDGVSAATSIDLVGRAAFVQFGVRVLAEAASFEALVEEVAVSHFDADRFRIDLHDPSERSAIGATAAAIALADVIQFGPDLGDPQHRFLVIPGEDGWRFGEVVAVTDAGYRRHDEKPWTTSSSLDARFARGLVNLVPAARSILDPCCGAGSIVLEAASLGLHAFGVDWKPAMVGMTNENLAHFGYSAVVERADSREHRQRADAIVTDLPYGHAIDADEATIRGILENCSELAPHAVFVAPADFSLWLRAAGYCDVDVVRVVKRRGFTRWIHTAESEHFRSR